MVSMPNLWPKQVASTMEKRLDFFDKLAQDLLLGFMPCILLLLKKALEAFDSVAKNA